MLENITLVGTHDSDIRFHVVSSDTSSALFTYRESNNTNRIPLARVINRGDPDNERIVLCNRWDITSETMEVVKAFLAAEASIAFEDIIDSRAYGFRAKVIDCIAHKTIDVYPAREV